jgi:hypothetical protein
MARKESQALGRVIVYGNPHYKHREENGWDKAPDFNEDPGLCEIFDIEEFVKDRIITSKYVLPLNDAVVSNSDQGLIYSYNVSLPYITETAHLAEVEKNIIVGQAFLYPGRSAPANKPSMMIWVLVGFMMILALVGMFK